MFKALIAIGLINYIAEHPFIIVVILGVVGFIIYLGAQNKNNQENQNQQISSNQIIELDPMYKGIDPELMRNIIRVMKYSNIADSSTYNWANPEIMKRMAWFMDSNIYDRFRIFNIVGQDMIDGHKLCWRLFNYKAGMLSEKLSLEEEKNLWWILNEAKCSVGED